MTDKEFQEVIRGLVSVAVEAKVRIAWLEGYLAGKTGISIDEIKNMGPQIHDPHAGGAE